MAFYIQVTKKILISFLYLIILTMYDCNHLQVSMSNCKEISDYIEIELHVEADTVKIDSIATFNVVFRNKCDTSIQFYPKAVIQLVKPFVAFGVNFIYSFNDTLDINRIAEIKPKSTFMNTYNVLINEKFFKVGENPLSLNYRCSELLKAEDKIYNKLCGTLNSNSVILFVLPSDSKTEH